MSGGEFNRNQTGASVAEFAIVATLFFMMIIGIIEFGRLFYTHNALTDAARRGARYAVLNKQASMDCVKNVVVYGETHVNPATCAPTGPPLIKGLDPDTNVNVDYNSPNPFGMNLGTATVTIQNYSFNLGVPLFTLSLPMPAYTTTLVAESAGEIPPDI